MAWIGYIFRKKQVGYNSIENLFTSLQSYISKKYTIKSLHVVSKGATPWVILRNIINFNTSNSCIYHITGDVHYMALAIRRNVILTIHDTGSALTGNRVKRLYVKLFWFWLPAFFVDYITVISHFTKNELVRIIPLFQHKIRVIPNPVGENFKYSKYSFNKDCPVILCVGTKENKNLERVFEAVRGIQCKLVIIGHLTSVQLKILEKSGVPFTNLYNLTQEEIVDVYKGSDLLCFPSIYEGFGMPIIEAQATGRPVITSNIGAMLEVAADSACLVNPFEIAEIREAVKILIHDDEYREILIEKGLENIRRFKLSHVAKEYLDLYGNLNSYDASIKE